MSSFQLTTNYKDLVEAYPHLSGVLMNDDDTNPSLPSNKKGSLQRLNSLTRKLSCDGITAKYNQIIEEQKNQGVIELALGPPVGQEFYLPHKPVIQQLVQSTKTCCLRCVCKGKSKRPIMKQMPLSWSSHPK